MSSTELNFNLPNLAFIIPCYNEADCIPNTIQKISKIVLDLIYRQCISKNSFIFFVDDGSIDDTFSEIQRLKSEYIKIIKLSKNEGHQYALLAGIHYVNGKVDCAISIDADLQDDLSVIGKMIEKYKEGYEVVLGVREDRSTDSLFKQYTAKAFYFLMRKLGVKLTKNHADFRLLSAQAIGKLSMYTEYNLFLRGILTLIGSKSTTISYSQGKRQV